VTDRDPDFGHDCGPECECFGAPDERVSRLRRDILASLIAVKGSLDQPYPDDPRWSPWTRFVERTLDRVDELAGIAKDALHGRELARLDVENERRLRDNA
jgi:hypothetical protein